MEGDERDAMRDEVIARVRGELVVVDIVQRGKVVGANQELLYATWSPYMGGT